jgi:oxygen-independent coproporphyrinogen-3 oxidase
MLRLRTTRGISQAEYEKDYLMPFEPLLDVIQPMAQRGLFLFENGRWILTPTGFLVSNQIIGRLQEAQERSEPLAKKR